MEYERITWTRTEEFTAVLPKGAVDQDPWQTVLAELEPLNAVYQGTPERVIDPATPAGGAEYAEQQRRIEEEQGLGD